MSFASNMQNTAEKLLDRYGEMITIVRSTEGAFNPATGGLASGSSSSFSAKGHPGTFNTQEIDNNLILFSDIKLLIRTNQEIFAGDTAIIADIDYRIMNVQKVRAQGQDIIYRCQLRA